MCMRDRWRVVRCATIRGAPLAEVARIAVDEGDMEAPTSGHLWRLRGVVSHQRYVTHSEAETLRRTQAALGRPEATSAALIPIRKSDAWWNLAQDERRAIFEE